MSSAEYYSQPGPGPHHPHQGSNSFRLPGEGSTAKVRDPLRVATAKGSWDSPGLTGSPSSHPYPESPFHSPPAGSPSGPPTPPFRERGSPRGAGGTRFSSEDHPDKQCCGKERGPVDNYSNSPARPRQHRRGSSSGSSGGSSGSNGSFREGGGTAGDREEFKVYSKGASGPRSRGPQQRDEYQHDGSPGVHQEPRREAATGPGEGGGRPRREARRGACGQERAQPPPPLHATGSTERERGPAGRGSGSGSPAWGGVQAPAEAGLPGYCLAAGKGSPGAPGGSPGWEGGRKVLQRSLSSDEEKDEKQRGRSPRDKEGGAPGGSGVRNGGSALERHAPAPLKSWDSADTQQPPAGEISQLPLRPSPLGPGPKVQGPGGPEAGHEKASPRGKGLQRRLSDGDEDAPGLPGSQGLRGPRASSGAAGRKSTAPAVTERPLKVEPLQGKPLRRSLLDDEDTERVCAQPRGQLTGAAPGERRKKKIAARKGVLERSLSDDEDTQGAERCRASRQQARAKAPAEQTPLVLNLSNDEEPVTRERTGEGRRPRGETRPGKPAQGSTDLQPRTRGPVAGDNSTAPMGCSLQADDPVRNLPAHGGAPNGTVSRSPVGTTLQFCAEGPRPEALKPKKLLTRQLSDDEGPTERPPSTGRLPEGFDLAPSVSTGEITPKGEGLQHNLFKDLEPEACGPAARKTKKVASHEEAPAARKAGRKPSGGAGVGPKKAADMRPGGLKLERSLLDDEVSSTKENFKAGKAKATRAALSDGAMLGSPGKLGEQGPKLQRKLSDDDMAGDAGVAGMRPRARRSGGAEAQAPGLNPTARGGPGTAGLQHGRPGVENGARRKKRPEEGPAKHDGGGRMTEDLPFLSDVCAKEPEQASKLERSLLGDEKKAPVGMRRPAEAKPRARKTGGKTELPAAELPGNVFVE